MASPNASLHHHQHMPRTATSKLHNNGSIASDNVGQRVNPVVGSAAAYARSRALMTRKTDSLFTLQDDASQDATARLLGVEVAAYASTRRFLVVEGFAAGLAPGDYSTPGSPLPPSEAPPFVRGATVFHSCTLPTVPLSRMAHALGIHLPAARDAHVLLYACDTMDKAARSFPRKAVTAHMLHRVFLASLLVAIKMLYDPPVRGGLAAVLCRCSGVPLWELNRLEVALLRACDWAFPLRPPCPKLLQGAARLGEDEGFAPSGSATVSPVPHHDDVSSSDSTS